MSTDSIFRRDSWPPTQLRLARSVVKSQAGAEPRPLLEDIDEDPLTYFLTPAPGLEDEDYDDAIGDFDAGIEDLSSPKDMVRSVSPSSLEGLTRTGPHVLLTRPISPEFDSDVPTSDDDEEEDYIRFSPPSSNKFDLLSLRDLALESLRYRPRSPVLGPSANALLSPASSYPAPSPRGRSYARGRHTTARSLSARSRPNHLWREPSPDVWSIREETEEELLEDMASDGEGNNKKVKPTEGKLKKKVRFVLPATEF